MSELKNSEVFSNVKVSYTLGATINTGDFSNIRPEYTVEAEVAEGVSPTEAKNRLKTLVHTWMENEINEIKADLG